MIYDAVGTSYKEYRLRVIKSIVKMTENVLQKTEELGYQIVGAEVTNISPADFKRGTVRVYVKVNRVRGVMPTGPIELSEDDIETYEEKE